MKKGTILTFLLFTFLTGCATQKTVGPEPEIASVPAVSREMAEGEAEMYIFNVSGWTLIPQEQKVTDNGKTIVKFPRNTYKKIFITAGHHELRVAGQKLELDVVEGQTYYVIAGYKPARSWAWPLAGSPVVIKEISEEEASNLLKEMKAID